MKILLTNTALIGRSGTEIFVAQLADELRRRGHLTILYAPLLGETGLELRSSGHLVFDHIADIGIKPDVIHAHHLGPALTALTAFPGIPAVFVSHSVASEFDAMPQHPAILRYLAVSDFVRTQRARSWLPVERIEVLRNAVDLRQFPDMRALPARPARALAVVKYPAGLALLRQFCSRAGFALEEVGQGVGNIVADLSGRYLQADLVFATGRSALEAAAAGCAVVLTDGGRFGGLIGPDRIEEMLNLNLGVFALPHALTEPALEAALQGYDPGAARQVGDYVREHASLSGQADRLLEIYTAAIEQGVGPEDRMKMAAMVEAYVPTHGDLPWRRLVSDLIGHAALARLNFLSQPIRYEVSEDDWDRNLAVERAVNAEQELAAARAHAEMLERAAERELAEARAHAEMLERAAERDLAAARAHADMLEQAADHTRQAAEAQLAGIHRSTSWRATAWLRWLGRRRNAI